jgi:protein TonB
MPKKNRKLKPVAIFLILSVFAHLCLWVSLNLTSVAPSAPQIAENVEVNYISPEQAQQLTKLSQIVEQKNRVNDEIDKAAKYLSAFDQKVIRETKAAHSGRFNNTPAGGASSQGMKQARDVKKQTKKIAQAKGELPSLKDLSPKFSPSPGPPEQVVRAPGQSTQTDDYLKDVKNGLQTMLSTREFVYYSYYSRIKEQISQYWEPNVREKVKIVYRQGRNIASAHDRVTQLMITLDKNGGLIKVEVITASGVHDLDDAAIEAFRSAAPFPNPPKGIVEHDGTIKIRWDFILEA